MIFKILNEDEFLRYSKKIVNRHVPLLMKYSFKICYECTAPKQRECYDELGIGFNNENSRSQIWYSDSVFLCGERYGMMYVNNNIDSRDYLNFLHKYLS